MIWKYPHDCTISISNSACLLLNFYQHFLQIFQSHCVHYLNYWNLHQLKTSHINHPPMFYNAPFCHQIWPMLQQIISVSLASIFATLVMLSLLPEKLTHTSIYNILQVKLIEIIFIFLLFPQSTSTLSGNPIGFTYRMYPQFDHI